MKQHNHHSDRTRALKAIADSDSRRELLKSILVVATSMNVVHDNNEDEHNNTTNVDNVFMNEVIDCNELIIDMLQYTYNDINCKRYLVERKPYRTGLSYAIFK
jgi:hypothetical protein